MSKVARCFPTNWLAVSRIVDSLNRQMDGSGVDPFGEDDERLTDEICAEYCRRFGQLDDHSENSFADALIDLDIEFLRRLLTLEEFKLAEKVWKD
jgi:hypothetical protein